MNDLFAGSLVITASAGITDASATQSNENMRLNHGTTQVADTWRPMTAGCT